MANGLAIAERRRILTAAGVDKCMATIALLLHQSIVTDSAMITMHRALACARTYMLSSYDAVYLETARAASLPIATLDKALRAAAVKVGMELVK